MYCPNCGSQTSLDTKFCRLCGMALHTISEAVGKHLDQNTEETDRKKTQLQRWAAITGFTALAMFTLLVIGAFICLSISKLAGIRFESFSFDYFAPIVMTVAFLLGLTAGGLMIYLEKIPKLRSSKQKGKAQTTARLTAHTLAESTPSITESTTELLKNDDSKLPQKTPDKLRV